MHSVEELKLITETTGMTTLITFDMFLNNIRGLCKQVQIPRVVVTKITDYIKGLGVSTAASRYQYALRKLKASLVGVKTLPEPVP